MSSSQHFGPERAIPPRAFGALLRHHRILAGLTQETLAERAGLSAHTISDLERGLSRTPQPGTLDLLAEALHLSGSQRADFEAAARREKLQDPSDLTLPAPISLMERQGGSPDQPATSGEPEEPGRRFDEGKLDTTPAEQRAGQESAPPLRLGPLPARRPSMYIMLGLLALLVVVAAGSGLGYWLKLGPFGKGATTATAVPGYAYIQPTHTGGTITYSTSWFPNSTNPWFDYAFGPPVVDALWGTPLVTSPSATLLPDELTEVPTLSNGDISQDGLTITLRLRPDLKWSDGQPLTADDFNYWLEVFQATYQPCSCGFDQIAHAQVLSAHTLVLHYKQRFAFALLYLPYAAPRHIWGSIPTQDLGNRDDVNLYPQVTSGPFMLKSDVPGKSITMVPNPYYVSTTLHRSVLEKLIYTAYPDSDSQIDAFLAGQTDEAEGFDLENGGLLKLAGVPGYQVAPSLTYEHLNFNLTQPALQDFQVRKAIEEAIDRCGMIQQVFQLPCARMRVDTIMPLPSPDYDPIIKTYPYNLAAARQDMQIAGWDCPSGGTCMKDGQPFPTLRLATRNDRPSRVQQAAFIQQDLEALGIPVTLKLYAPDVFFNDYNDGGILTTGQFDLATWADFFGLDDDLNFSSYFESSNIPSASNIWGQNMNRVNDPVIDADLAEGRVALDPARRVDIYKSLEQELVQQVYFVPLVLALNFALVNPNIGNFYENPLTTQGYGQFYQGNWWNIGDWFLMR